MTYKFLDFFVSTLKSEQISESPNNDYQILS